MAPFIESSIKVLTIVTVLIGFIACSGCENERQPESAFGYQIGDIVEIDEFELAKDYSRMFDGGPGRVLKFQPTRTFDEFAWEEFSLWVFVETREIWLIDASKTFPSMIDCESSFDVTMQKLEERYGKAIGDTGVIETPGISAGTFQALRTVEFENSGRTLNCLGLIKMEVVSGEMIKREALVKMSLVLT